MNIKSRLLAVMGRFTRGAAGAAEETPPAQFPENSFIQLATQPSVQGWKRKLYSLIEGEGDETLNRLGSIEQYVRVLLAESKSADARYYFSEALSQIVQEWTPTVLEPADRLHNMLLLVAAFTPAVGFTKTLDHLNSCGANKRSAEEVSGEARPVDLYKRGLLALSRYYPTAPQYSHSDQGFQAYTRLLEKNLEDERYAGYAAVRLLRLNLLDIKSEKVSSLLLSSDGVFNHVFERLIDRADEPEEVESVKAKLGDLLVVCAKSDNLKKFEGAAAALGVEFNPEGDYEGAFPALRLPDGTLLSLRLDVGEIKGTSLARYVEYNQERLVEMLSASAYQGDKISKYVSGYLTKVIDDSAAIATLVNELSQHKVHIIPLNSEVALRIPNRVDPVPLELDPKVLEKYLIWRMKLRLVAMNAG